MPTDVSDDGWHDEYHDAHTVHTHAFMQRQTRIEKDNTMQHIRMDTPHHTTTHLHTHNTTHNSTHSYLPIETPHGSGPRRIALRSIKP